MQIKEENCENDDALFLMKKINIHQENDDALFLMNIYLLHRLDAAIMTSSVHSLKTNRSERIKTRNSNKSMNFYRNHNFSLM